ncbi:hypothetical protein CSUB01_11478 [Colletotrichum sublineola]|uniref:Uncharacterized protein n=1 Tax=Colletotrichum sublineola TaxID=1173701 RepID=A0A066XTD4_COLSU|nr:hypothetical protein CSUB01_11478 [Colletotrichum sublineola]
MILGIEELASSAWRSPVLLANGRIPPPLVYAVISIVISSNLSPSQAHDRASCDLHPDDDRVLWLPQPAAAARSSAAATPHAAQSAFSAAPSSSSNPNASRLSSAGSCTLRRSGDGGDPHPTAPFSRSCCSA